MRLRLNGEAVRADCVVDRGHRPSRDIAAEAGGPVRTGEAARPLPLVRNTITANSAMPAKTSNAPMTVISSKKSRPLRSTPPIPRGKNDRRRDGNAGLDFRQRARRRLRHQPVVKAGEEKADEADKIDVGVSRRQREVLADAHRDAQGHAAERE